MNQDFSNNHILEQAYRKNRYVHTVEDLYKIKLDPSRYIVRPVFGQELCYPPNKAVNWDARLEAAYKRYLEHPGSGKWWMRGWDRQLTRWQDRLRWKLHLKLLKWGVII